MSKWNKGDRLVVISGGPTPYGSKNIGKQAEYVGPVDDPRDCEINPLEPMYDSNTGELFPAGSPGYAGRAYLRKVEDPDKDNNETPTEIIKELTA
ncbi:MAG: hypothetical protein AB7U98_13705 [Candidatus Nitrosocosmicus sp.]